MSLIHTQHVSHLPHFDSLSVTTPSTSQEELQGSQRTGSQSQYLSAQTHLTALLHRVDVLDVEVTRIERLKSTIRDIDETTCGRIYDEWVGSGNFQKLTNFHPDEVRNMIQNSLHIIAAHRTRGPKPKLSWADHWVVYLYWLKSGTDLEELGTLLKIPMTTLATALTRIRPIVHETLVESWWTKRRRPQALNQPNFPHIALLIDSTTISVFRPHTSFAEAKIYWDGKNHIYGIKKEVAVMAHPPHYALFSSTGFVASKHDYQYHKESFERYLPYLAKTTEESHQLRNDTAEPSWAALFDSGYVGPPTDTPGMRRIFVKKGNLGLQEQMLNKELCTIRNPVEQFFGRVWKLWKVARGVYRWDHRHFDVDIDVCILLTNEHIKRHDLVELDYRLYLGVCEQRAARAEEVLQQRKAVDERYKTRKKQRLAALKV